MWGSRRGIGLLRTRGDPSRWTGWLRARGDRAGGWLRGPGHPPRDPTPSLGGVCRRTRVLPGAQISHALRDVLNTEMLAPRLLASLTAKLLTLSQQRDFVVPEAIGNNRSYCC